MTIKRKKRRGKGRKEREGEEDRTKNMKDNRVEEETKEGKMERDTTLKKNKQDKIENILHRADINKRRIRGDEE